MFHSVDHHDWLSRKKGLRYCYPEIPRNERVYADNGQNSEGKVLLSAFNELQAMRMDNTITVVYPQPSKPSKKKEGILAARTEWRAQGIDFSPIENDLRKLITMFDNLSKGDSKYEVNEARLSVGFGRNTNGDIQVGISAKIFPFFSAEGGGKVESSRSENQLFEIVVKKKT